MLTTLLALALAPPVEKLKGDPNPTPVLSLTLIRPQEQLAQILSLFEGSRASSPATALALWKQAKPGRALSKAAEAGIAILNPEMVGELGALDRANLVLTLNKMGRVDWWASLPKDDGTFSALATAMVITDGTQLPALGDRTVDRIGPPGAPVMTRIPGGTGSVLASSREELVRVHSKSPELDVASGFVAEIDPSGLKGMHNLSLRRVGEGLISVGCSRIHAVGGLGPEGLKLSFAGRYVAPSLLGRARIDPTWLDSVPSRRLIVAWAFAIDPSPEFWNSAFSLADRVEKTDPARAGLAPLRLRLALLTAAAKIRPEAELFPHLRGVSGHLTGDERGSIARGVFGLHVDTPDRAKALADEFVPRLATLGSLGTPIEQPDGVLTWSARQPLGTIECQAVGSSLWIGWGRDALKEAREARRDAALHGDGGSIPKRASLSNCQRFAIFCPRISPERKSAASQVVWKGEIREQSTEDVIFWTGLKEEVRQSLEQLLPRTGERPSMNRLIDLHTDWLLQYAPETTVFDPKFYPRVAARLGQGEGYLQATRAAILSCYRSVEDWASQADPWRALALQMTRIEAEFPGRLLADPEDLSRWRDDVDGLAWGVLGVEGFDSLVRSSDDLDRLPDLYRRGVRLFQPVYTTTSLLAGSSSPGDDRGLSDLGREFLACVAILASGDSSPRPILDLAHLNPQSCSDILDWFESDSHRLERTFLIYSHGCPAHEGFRTPRALTADNLKRLRSIGGFVGVGVTPPFFTATDQIRHAIETVAATPFLGRVGYEAIGIGTDFLGVDAVIPELANASSVVAWLEGSFERGIAQALISGNGERFLTQAIGDRDFGTA